MAPIASSNEAVDTFPDRLFGWIRRLRRYFLIALSLRGACKKYNCAGFEGDGEKDETIDACEEPPLDANANPTEELDEAIEGLE